MLLVQATSIGHVRDRLARCRARVETALWLRAGGCFEVWGWEIREGRWALKRVALGPDDLKPVLMDGPRARWARRGERQRGLFDTQKA